MYGVLCTNTKLLSTEYEYPIVTLFNVSLRYF